MLGLCLKVRSVTGYTHSTKLYQFCQKRVAKDLTKILPEAC